jgi:hypothetical protein
MNFSIRATLDDLGYNIDALEAGLMESLNLQVGQLAMAARSEWIRLAQDRLETSREVYVNGLRQSESFTMLRGSGRGRPSSYEITLVGNMPNNFEYGMGPFDMKGVRPGWLGGKSSKIGKDGKKYVVIPFRHSTSGSPRFNYTGKAKSVSDPDLKTQLRKTVKTYGLDRMVRTATGQVVTGIANRLPKSAPVHPYLQGMVRTQQAISGTTSTGLSRGQGSLMTFRVMSENSKPDSWIHPGLRPVNLLAEVEQFVDNEMRKIATTILGVR